MRNDIQSDRLTVAAGSSAFVAGTAQASEQAAASGVYKATCMRILPEYMARALAISNTLSQLFEPNSQLKAELQAELAEMPREPVWEDTFSNLVTTAGKNDMLDKYLAGSAYTAAFYMMLISSVGYTAIAAADTMASHAGWTEAGIANAPTYSQGARPTAAWSAASAGAKALSASLTFSITGTGTIKGAGLSTVSTKDGTTGILFSAGLFTGGDKLVANLDTISVSYSLSV